MVGRIECITPVDGSVYVTRDLAGPDTMGRALERARRAGTRWAATPLEERLEILGRAVDAFVAAGPGEALEITWQMGRPISQSPGEIAGFEERARHMLAIAPEALADVEVEPVDGFHRFIRRQPLGTVFVMAPWNYPYLTSVNSVIPALAAGNAVVLKHSAQTPLCAERYQAAFESAGLPSGVFTHLHLSHDDALGIITGGGVDFVSFTGSVAGGRAVQGAAARRFIGTGLELGGKDPAYVRHDADLDHAVANLADGAFFNSGQSCCGIERIYVHHRVYEPFVEGLVEAARAYRLGDPTDPDVNLGPMVRTAAADFVRGQIAEAVTAGARALVDPAGFPRASEGTPYLAPQVLVDVDHSLGVMTEESFGPVVGVMAVGSDEEAVELMNDSDYGLTAAIWTSDPEAAEAVGQRIDTGTWFQNRCDYLDPALAWTGVKDSGRGCSLSSLGYSQLTRPKSFHLRLGT